MAHPSKRKGTSYEREIVAAFQAAGLDAERAWGSDGRCLTTATGEPCSSDVDVLVQGRLKIQAKRRASVAGYLKPPEGAHCAVVREDRGESIVTLPLSLFTALLARVYGDTTQPTPRTGSPRQRLTAKPKAANQNA